MTHDQARHCLMTNIETTENIAHSKESELTISDSKMMVAPRPMPSPIDVGDSSDKEAKAPPIIKARTKNTVATMGNNLPDMREELVDCLSIIAFSWWVSKYKTN